MNSNSILASNLLDIIFENRNKDYGAYVLRKNYNKRLLKSLTIALALVFAFIAVSMILRKNTSSLNIIPALPDVTILSIEQIKKPLEPKRNVQPHVKQSKELVMKALIVKDQLVPNKQTPQLEETFFPGVESNAAPSLEGTNETPSVPVEQVKPVQAVATTNKSIIDSSPDIPPQFPGGVKELMKFLKRNLNTPQDMQEEQQIAVK